MTSAVDIVNQALVQLGAAIIITFEGATEDDQTEAQLANILYHRTKESLLRSYPWNCAVARRKLAQEDVDPVNEWDFKFALPDDNLRVLQIYSGDDKARKLKQETDPAYQVEGDYVLTWQKNIYAKYVRNIKEDKMDTHVVQALVAQLAAEFAYPITGSNNTQAQFSTLADNAMHEARITDSQENPHSIFKVDRLARVRW